MTIGSLFSGIGGLERGLEWAGLGPTLWQVGLPQEDWEPPRTLHGVPNRPRRVKALGNAVVPHCAYVAGLRLRERMGR